MYLIDSILIIVISIVLSYLVYRRGLLNFWGSVTALVISLILGFQGGLIWIFLLLLFLASAFLATKYKFRYKRKKGLQEGRKGERGVINVLANGSIPTAIALLHGAENSFGILGIGFLSRSIAVFLFVTAVASAASDTLASEMGVLSKNAYLITNLKRVEPGTNGGVSYYGQMWAFIGSFYTFIIAFAVFSIFEGRIFPVSWVLMGGAFGFISCQIDSVLGATLERKKILGKSAVNISSVAITVLISGVFIWLVG
ncbi:MAG: DUF92 domain-containing protein [Thermoplasmata archaeon]